MAFSARSYADSRKSALWLTNTDVSLFQLSPSNLSGVTQALGNLNMLLSITVKDLHEPGILLSYEEVGKLSWRFSVFLDLLSVNRFSAEGRSVVGSRRRTNCGVKPCVAALHRLHCSPYLIPSTHQLSSLEDYFSASANICSAYFIKIRSLMCLTF